eukprot:462478_1
MAANFVDTPEGHEEVFTFDFEAWIDTNGLKEIKDHFIKYNMTTVDTISTESKEFAKFIADPTLLSAKSQFIPKIFSAIQAVQLQKQNSGSSNKPIVCIISEKENDIINSMKSNLKQVENMEIQYDELRQKSTQSLLCLAQNKNTQIKEARQKIQNTINECIRALKLKEKQLLNKLNSIQAENNDTKTNDTLMKTIFDSLNETKQLLTYKIDQCNNYIHSNVYSDIQKRKKK